MTTDLLDETLLSPEAKAAYDAEMSKPPSAADVLDPDRIRERARAAAENADVKANDLITAQREAVKTVVAATAPLEEAYSTLVKAMVEVTRAVEAVREARTTYDAAFGVARDLKVDPLPDRIPNLAVAANAQGEEAYELRQLLIAFRNATATPLL